MTRFGKNRGHSLGNTHRHPHSSGHGQSTQEKRAEYATQGSGGPGADSLWQLCQKYPVGAKDPCDPMGLCTLVWEFTFLPLILP